MEKNIKKQIKELRKSLIKEINDRLMTTVPGYSTARYALMDLREEKVRFVTEEENNVTLEAVAVMNALGKNIYLLLREKDRENENHYWATTLEKDKNRLSLDELTKLHQAVTNNKDEKRIRAYNPIDDLINHDPTKRILERVNQSWEEYQKMINK